MKKAAGRSGDDTTPTSKRPRVASSGKPHLLKRYPVNVVSREQMSADALEEAECALKEEEEDPNPDPQVYLPLMKSTFDFRRQYVVSEAESAIEIIEKYSFLKLEDVVNIMCT